MVDGRMVGGKWQRPGAMADARVRTWSEQWSVGVGIYLEPVAVRIQDEADNTSPQLSSS